MPHFFKESHGRRNIVLTNSCGFRNFTKGVVTKAKYPKCIEKLIKLRLSNWIGTRKKREKSAMI